ncbi:hypothetical protein CRE_17292 [Caenorhabditis remanei]|uniref:Uncharacterized protein n=1 Tax=Caenorhabditis remanei TaxID=31234 RepID=E3MRY3_CAERE|nr:hypothetical protein CRE_17292 [Caenorhabditis remanei]
MDNRDNARSVCGFFGASLTIPENQQEFDAIKKALKIYENITEGHIIDGEISPHCKAKYAREKHLFMKNKKDCDILGNAFIFDDVNTDPTFIVKQYPSLSPTEYTEEKIEGFKEIPLKMFGSCLSIIQEDWELHLSYCEGNQRRPGAKTIFNSVVCGMPPE